ncbi:MAG: hypothetical protein IPO91_19180 [Chloroflexi bacterium]|nr:hypothetical protein [Chloroflexota bacterium]
MNDDPLYRLIQGSGNTEGNESYEALKLRIRELETALILQREQYIREVQLVKTEFKLRLELARREKGLKPNKLIITNTSGREIRWPERMFFALRHPDPSMIIFVLSLILAAIAGAGGYWLVLRNETNAVAVLATNQTATSAALALVYTPTASSDIGIGVQTTVPEAVSALSTGEAVLTQSAIIADAQATSILRRTELAHVQTTLDFQATQIAPAYSPTPLVPTVIPTPAGASQATEQANTINPLFVLAILVGIVLSVIIFLIQRPRQGQASAPQPNQPSNNRLVVLTTLAPLITSVLITLIGIIPTTIPLLQSPTATPTLENLRVIETREAEGTAAMRLATLDSQVQQLTQTAQANSVSTSEAISLAISETADVEVAPEATEVIATDTVSPETTSLP